MRATMKRLAGAGLSAALLTAGCGGAGGGGTLDPGPPPRPLFKEVEGLKWGMTREEVRAAWGAGDDGGTDSYPKKGGYPTVRLGYASIPSGGVVHTDLVRDPKDDSPVKLLIWARFEGDATFKKETVRADLVSRFGQPLTDARLLEANLCQGPNCELFRAAECTLVKVSWNPANPGAWPDHLIGLTYLLAPDSLPQYVPRPQWPRLRGSVPTSYTPEARARFDKVGRQGGAEAETLAKLTADVGPPNLYLETAPGEGTLFYLFLDGSLQTIKIEKGRYAGAMGSTRN